MRFPAAVTAIGERTYQECVQSGRRADRDEATLVTNVAYHLTNVASDVPLESELSEQSSSIGHGRFSLSPFERTLNHHSSDLDSPSWNKKCSASRKTHRSWECRKCYAAILLHDAPDGGPTETSRQVDTFCAREGASACLFFLFFFALRDF